MNRHRGFENLGNTCYLSSIVMAISSSTNLSNHLQNLVRECKKSKMPSEQLILRFKFIDQLSKVIQVVRSTHIAPSASLLHQLTGRIDPNFRNRYPQDAHEFLGIITGVIEQIYDAMDKQKNRLTADDRSFRKFPMFFEIKNCVTCKRCGTRSYSRESQVGLNVDMNGHGEAGWSFWNSWRLIERMSGSEQFFCGKCNRKVDATRTTRPISLPTVLVVRYYLFRVKFTKDRLSVSKVFPVRFPPLRIPLSEVPSYQKEMQGFYTLKAMVVHRGTQINDGHYISFVRSEHSKWRLFNDERTCEISLQELQNSTNSSSTPYLLFYEKSN